MSESGLQTLPKVRRSPKEVESMKDERIYLLAELTILPEFLEEVKAILREALVPTLQEPGCEALYETGRDDDPRKLVFFEVFSSAAAHEFHLEQDYTKRLFASPEAGRWTASQKKLRSLGAARLMSPPQSPAQGSLSKKR
jgi:quinol monooxygenase YgiN